MRVCCLILASAMVLPVGFTGCNPKSPKTYNGPIDKNFERSLDRTPKTIRKTRSVPE